MAVVSMVVGAVTDDGATFVAKVDGGGPVQVAVADNATMDDATLFGPIAVDAQGVAKVSATGLDPDTALWWQTFDDGDSSVSSTGRFRTLPAAGTAASFTVGLSGDAGLAPVYPGSGSELAPDRVSNHTIFTTIRQRALDEDWSMFAHLGDLHYYDLGSGSHGIVGGGSLANYRTAYDDVLAQSRQAALYRDVAWHYQWDDHDYGPNNSDGTLATKANALQVYGERVPHYTLGGIDGIYQSWQVGRVQFVALDTRYNRSPNSDPDGPSKTMLGSPQKTWLEGILSMSTAQALVVLSPTPWNGAADDTWAGFATERDELVALFDAYGWLGRMVMVQADRHALGLTGGGTNDHGAFPLLQAAALDASPSAPLSTERFDIVPDTPGRAQYGTIEVTDLGAQILIRLAAWRETTELGSYTLTVVLETPTQVGSAQVNEFAPLITGTHRPVFEARLLTTYQEGDDPTGDDVPILDGTVRYDATTEVLGLLKMRTQGTNPTTGQSWFPRRASSDLAPYGNELFVRRGVDKGDEILWSPLGYFRIEDSEQDDDPEAPIRLSGSDRMAGIVEADVLNPQVFAATRPVSSVFESLVTEVYPDATVVFDDSSGAEPIGRQLVVDDSRYEPLLELADGLGKVFYVDGEGRFRVESAPDDDTIAWRVVAGRGGVLLRSSRRLSRRGGFNAVIVDGEGGGTASPARGVAVDNGPNSPTRFGSRYGQVVHQVSIPSVTTEVQAQAAAREILRRNLGAHYSADFGSIVNPALRPRMVLWVEQRNGDGERHAVETLTIPLVADAAMVGTTRERTLVSIGSQVVN